MSININFIVNEISMFCWLFDYQTLEVYNALTTKVNRDVPSFNDADTEINNKIESEYEI